MLMFLRRKPQLIMSLGHLKKEVHRHLLEIGRTERKGAIQNRSMVKPLTKKPEAITKECDQSVYIDISVT